MRGPRYICTIWSEPPSSLQRILYVCIGMQLKSMPMYCGSIQCCAGVQYRYSYCTVMYLNIFMTKCDDGVAKRRDQSFQIWCGSCTFGFRLASYSCSDLLDVQICFLIYAREGIVLLWVCFNFAKRSNYDRLLLEYYFTTSQFNSSHSDSAVFGPIIFSSTHSTALYA